MIPLKKSKAFSYFSVIAKNWFIHKVKKNTRAIKREVHLDDVAYSNHDYDQVSSYLTVEVSYEIDRESAEFWYFLWKEIDAWKQTKPKRKRKESCGGGEDII